MVRKQRRLKLRLCNPPLRDGVVRRVYLDADEPAASPHAGNARRARTHEGVKHQVAGLRMQPSVKIISIPCGSFASSVSASPKMIVTLSMLSLRPNKDYNKDKKGKESIFDFVVGHFASPPEYNILHLWHDVIVYTNIPL